MRERYVRTCVILFQAPLLLAGLFLVKVLVFLQVRSLLTQVLSVARLRWHSPQPVSFQPALRLVLLLQVQVQVQSPVLVLTEHL